MLVHQNPRYLKQGKLKGERGGGGVRLRGQLFLLSILSALVLAGQLIPAVQAGEESHLAQDITADSPANGGDVLLDSLSSFEPGPGQAVIDPGNPNEETVTFNGIGTDPIRLFGVTRSAPLAHLQGAIVRPITESGSTQSSSTGSDPPEMDPDDHDTSQPTPSVSATTSEQSTANGSLQVTSNTPSSEPSGDDQAGSSASASSSCWSAGVMNCVPPECQVAINGSQEAADSNVVDVILACVRALGDDIDLGCSDPASCQQMIRDDLCILSSLFCELPPHIDVSALCDPYCSLPSAPHPSAYLQVGGKWIRIEDGSVVNGGTIAGGGGTCVTQSPLVIGADIGTGEDGFDIDWGFDDYCRIVFDFVGGGQPPLPTVDADTPLPGEFNDVGGETGSLGLCLLNGPCGDPIAYNAGVRLTMYEQYDKVATETIQRMTYTRSTYDNSAWEGRNDGGACTHSSFPGWHIKECTYHIDWQGPGVGMKRVGYYWNHAYTPIHYKATATYWTHPGGYHLLCSADGQWPRSWHGECEGYQKQQ
jgi:hypothetical protein